MNFKKYGKKKKRKTEEEKEFEIFASLTGNKVSFTFFVFLFLTKMFFYFNLSSRRYVCQLYFVFSCLSI